MTQGRTPQLLAPSQWQTAVSVLSADLGSCNTNAGSRDCIPATNASNTNGAKSAPMHCTATAIIALRKLGSVVDALTSEPLSWKSALRATIGLKLIKFSKRKVPPTGGSARRNNHQLAGQV